MRKKIWVQRLKDTKEKQLIVKSPIVLNLQKFKFI
jgi:hypothetical protein